MSQQETLLLIGLAVMNLAALVLFCVDKALARRQRRRIPEAVLLAVCAMFGALGGLLAMALTRHKTNARRHPAFVFGVPAAFVLQMAALWYLLP